MRLGADAEGVTGWSTKPTAGAEMLAVVDAVRSGQFSTQQRVATELGLSAVQVGRLKVRAVSQGLISEAEWRAGLAGPVPERR